MNERSPRLTTAAIHGLRIGVVIPAYQVAPYIERVIAEIPDFVHHIIVVDDASSDDVQAVLANVEDPRVHVARHERNSGVGAAMMTGYKVADELGCEIMVKLDGDGQMDPLRILDLIEPVAAGRADYAKGNRFLHRSRLIDMPAVRRYGNVALTFLAKCASGHWKMFDPSNGFTALHARAWRVLEKSRLARRYFFETSMLIEVGRVRGVVEDVPIPARYRGEPSSLSPAKLALEFPPRLLIGTLRRIGAWYFLYDFTPVSVYLVTGVFGLLFALGWGGYHWFVSFQTGVPATTGTVMLAVVSLILGVQLLLQTVTLDIQNAPDLPIQNRPAAQRVSDTADDV